MRSSILLGLVAAALFASSHAVAASDAKVRVDRVAGEPVSAQRLTAIADGQITLVADAGETKIPLADVVEIAFGTPADAPRPWSPKEVGVDLASGETLFGEIRRGDEHGFTLASPLLGEVLVSLDHVLSVRFLQRLARVPEPPDLRAPETTDVLHLNNGDRLAGTIQSFSDKGISVESATGEKVLVGYDKVTALRVNNDLAKKRPAGALLVAALRDGTHVIGAQPAARDGRLQMQSVSGFRVEASLADVVAAYVVSDRFAYLSDLPAGKTEVQPFWKPVAGEPNVLYAPRMDRSFTGNPLRSGGRTWVKGLGVYSGTSMTWDLAGAYAEFRGAAGIDDGAGPLGGVVFEVLVDGQSKWSSGFVRAAGAEARGKASPVQAPRIDLKGAKTLTLRVLSGDADDPWPIADEADWLGAMLVR